LRIDTQLFELICIRVTQIPSDQEEPKFEIIPTQAGGGIDGEISRFNRKMICQFLLERLAFV